MGQVRPNQHSHEIPTLVSGPGTLELEVGKRTVTAAVKRTSVPLSTRNTFSVADDARHTCTGCVCRRISLGTNISSVQVTVRNHGATAVNAQDRKVSVSRDKEVRNVVIVRQAELPVRQLVHRGTIVRHYNTINHERNAIA